MIFKSNLIRVFLDMIKKNTNYCFPLFHIVYRPQEEEKKKKGIRKEEENKKNHTHNGKKTQNLKVTISETNFDFFRFFLIFFVLFLGFFPFFLRIFYFFLLFFIFSPSFFFFFFFISFNPFL